MTEHSKLTPGVLWTMAMATGLCVANLYYNQPLLEQMRTTFDVSVSAIGLIPLMTQMGYAVGMLFLIPLGDMFERKRLIVGMTALSSLVTFATAFSDRFEWIALMSILLGLTTMTPQLIIPMAAHLSDDQTRGRVLGFVMSGLLLGVLLARTVSGFVGGAFGWRVMYVAAAGLLAALTCVLAFILPRSEPSYRGTYAGLLRTLVMIVRTQPILREAAFIGAMLFGAFSAFWATLIFLMQTQPFDYGAQTVGLFGLLGASGAIAAPVMGRIVDKQGPLAPILASLAVTMLSFVVYWFSAASLFGLAIGVLLMDVGAQSGHIANQRRIFGLLPEARSRINTIYMFSYFVGGALGSGIGTWSWNHFGWNGVCAASLVFVSAGTGVFCYSRFNERRP